MKIANLCIAAISCLTIAAAPQQASRECVNQPPDSKGFGNDVAFNNKYLAVTDLRKNRVIVYSRNDNSQWVKYREIIPPKDSIYRADKSFGRGLQLDGDVLAIGAKLIRTLPGKTGSEAFHGRYLVRLDSESEVEEIDLPVERKQDSVLFNLLTEGEIKQIEIPYNGEKGFTGHNGFNYNFAFNNNFLLVGSSVYPTGGGAWLYNLDQTEEKPLKISTPNTFIGRTVALSEKYAAVGQILLGDYIEPDIALKTIVRAIDTGSTTVIDAYGELSLSDNIIAIMRYGSFDQEQTDLLRVFRLNDNAQPQLIIERKDSRENSLERGWVQNGSLVTVESHYDPKISARRYIRVCLESIH